MSHLQKTFIAKAKSQSVQAKQPHRMTRGMIMRQATHIFTNNRKGKNRKDLHFWFYCQVPPDHQIFTLRK